MSEVVTYRVNAVEHEPKTNLMIGDGQTTHRKTLLDQYFGDPRIPRVSKGLVDAIFSLKDMCRYKEEYSYDDRSCPVYDQNLPTIREIELRINGSPYVVLEGQMTRPDAEGIYRRGFITRHLKRNFNGCSIPLNILISYVTDDNIQFRRRS